MTDLELIVDRLFRFVDGDRSNVFAFDHPGTPIPKARARFARNGHMYTPGNTKDAESALVYRWRVAQARRLPVVDTMAIIAIFYVSSYRRKDTDNLIKLVMDAGTKARVWNDDSQIVAQAAFLELDRDHPRTLVAACPFVSTLSQAPLLTATGALSKGGQ